MDTLTDRLTLWVLRFIATAMLFAGISLLVAGVPLFSAFIESSVVRTIAAILLKLSGVFVLGGGAALYLSRPRDFLLPNERTAISDEERPDLGGWLIALALVLVVLPAWLVVRLQPFLDEWGLVVDLLAMSGIWEGANANWSGIVLLPIFAALTPPLFELAAMIAFVVVSAALLMLLLARSRRFPRIYLVCTVLLSALVIASVLGADAAMLAGGAIQQLIEGSSASAQEAAQLQDIVSRYTTIVSSTARVLVWTLCGYLIWVPAMFLSRHVRTIFAMDVRDQAADGVIDIEAITSPPR